ncbi:hypothetical protein P885DRAFT_63615 [Corynascus similis CBS 632.67]
MTSTRSSFLLPLLAATTNLPLSARGFGFSGYGEAFPGRVGPWDANSTFFLNAIAASNATGIFHIPGYDVSKPYPGEPIDGWAVHLTALDLSKPSPYYIRPEGHPMVGHSLKIQAPDALLQDNDEEDGTKEVLVDPSWGMCLWDFDHPSHLEKERYNNRANKPLAADGSCKGFLSDACVAALKKATEEAYEVADSAETTRGQYGSLVTCSSLETPDECGEHGPGGGGTDLPSYGGVPLRFLNGSVTQTDGWEFEGDAGELYNSTADLRDFWDSMVLNYWVLVTAFVNATADPDVPGWERGRTLAEVHCVAPNGAGTGKGFTFSGVVPANAKISSSGSGGKGSDADAKQEDGNSGAGLVIPGRWMVWASLALPVVLWSWV